MIKRLLVCILTFYSMSLSIALHASLQQPGSALDPIVTPHFDSFYIAERAVLPKARKVSITDVSVSFDSNWLFKFKSDTTFRYRQFIVNEYSQMVRKQIKTKLEKAGWQVVENNGDDVLSVKVHLKDLFIEGPVKSNREHMLVRSIGRSSIVIEVNGTDNQPIFMIEDRRSAGGLSGYFIETDRAMNYSWFNKLVGNWATVFVAYLDMSTPTLANKS